MWISFGYWISSQKNEEEPVCVERVPFDQLGGQVTWRQGVCHARLWGKASPGRGARDGRWGGPGEPRWLRLRTGRGGDWEAWALLGGCLDSVLERGGNRGLGPVLIPPLTWSPSPCVGLSSWSRSGGGGEALLPEAGNGDGVWRAVGEISGQRLLASLAV